MSEQNPQATAALLRRLQIIAPITMIVIAALIYWLWSGEEKNLIAGIIAFLAIPDFFMFKFLADRMENQ